VISVLAQTFSQGFIVASYYINTGEFAKNCENKDKPKLRCNGKCQLMKKINQQEKKEQQQYPLRKMSYKNIVISSRSFFATILVMGFDSKIAYTLLNITNTVDRSSGIFHPPQS
jgi:hypothetical protein